MYKVLFIDEEQESIDAFLDFVEESKNASQIEVIEQFPLDDIEKMIEHIISVNPDGIITDFRLNEIKTDVNYNVPYNGTDLVQEFRKVRDQFPCFVLTSYDDYAVNESEDVNLVYVKNILHSNDEESKARATFLDRVIKQIEHYKSRLSDAEEELKRLIEKRQRGEANHPDEQRIIELDRILEKALDNRATIPDSFKEISNLDRLNTLITKVDELTKKVEQKNDNG